MAKKEDDTSWESSDRWYGNLVGEKGHYYHQSVIFPNSFKLLELEKIESWLDLGCGNGVLSRLLPKTVQYVGVDSSKGLLAQAKQSSPKSARFLHGDATQKLPLEKLDFTHASFILSLQNMEDGRAAIAQASKHLKSGGKLLIVLNHPCFRIPRQSEWGYDEKTKTQYRRLNGYMKSMKIPISMNPGKKEESATTYSFHHPLSTYTHWLKDNSLSLISIEEWISDKKSTGARAKAEDRARLEFPLFLALFAEKK